MIKVRYVGEEAYMSFRNLHTKGFNNGNIGYFAKRSLEKLKLVDRMFAVSNVRMVFIPAPSRHSDKWDCWETTARITNRSSE